jgi:hypothetical protein
MKTLFLFLILMSSLSFAQTSQIDLGIADVRTSKNDHFIFEITPGLSSKVKLRYTLQTRTSTCERWIVLFGQMSCAYRKYTTHSHKKVIMLDIEKSSTKLKLQTQKFKLSIKRVGNIGGFVNHDLVIIDGEEDQIEEKHRFAIIGTKFIITNSTTRDSEIVDGRMMRDSEFQFAKDATEQYMNGSSI